MSQMVTRQGPVGEDIDKRQTASPVKEMKKKMAANAEKEKIAAEKNVDKSTDKHTDKTADKATDKKEKKEAEKHTDKAAEKKEKSADKSQEKKDKSADKSIDKKDKATDKSVDKKEKTVEKKDKPAEKKDKGVDKHAEKSTEKKESAGEKHVEETQESSTEKAGKATKEEDKTRKAESIKHNGEASRAQNGKASNGTASESDDGDEEMVIVEQDNDEMFPELAYDDTSDTEPLDDVGRSITRRSQVKVTRTPETPRPASVKQTDKETDDSKEMKLLKLKEDILVTDRRLRSANSPKPSEKRSQEKDSPKKMDPAKKSDSETKTAEETGTEDKQENAQKSEATVTEMVIEVENSEGGDARRDTRYSRSRVKVSPYRRSARLADHTATSILANYTGNNTTMEMDITESSLVSEEPSCDTSAAGAAEDSYLASLRTIRARRSYRDLKPLTLSHTSFNTSHHSMTSLNTRESNVRPTGTVVGRKRRPEAGEGGAGAEAGRAERDTDAGGEGAKRPRLLERLARPFRTHTSTPLPARRAAEIVGINTDLPQSAPVAADDAFDPETIKPTPTAPLAHATKPTPTGTPVLVPSGKPALSERDSKRCVVM